MAQLPARAVSIVERGQGVELHEGPTQAHIVCTHAPKIPRARISCVRQLAALWVLGALPLWHTTLDALADRPGRLAGRSARRPSRR
jgi:hypothetical protein